MKEGEKRGGQGWNWQEPKGGRKQETIKEKSNPGLGLAQATEPCRLSSGCSRGGFLGVDGAPALLPVSLWQGIGVAGAEALPGDLVSSHCPLEYHHPSLVAPCSQTCPQTPGPSHPTCLPRSPGGRGRGELARAWESYPSGSVPPFFPANLGEGGLGLYPPGPLGAGAADVGDFQEEEAGRGRKG